MESHFTERTALSLIIYSGIVGETVKCGFIALKAGAALTICQGGVRL
jgi:hypothetical protein